MRYYHVASGAENPLSYRNLYGYTREYFLQWPMTDKSGSPVAVPEFTFPPIEAYRAQLRRKLKAAGRCRQAAVGCSVEADAPSAAASESSSQRGGNGCSTTR